MTAKKPKETLEQREKQQTRMKSLDKLEDFADFDLDMFRRMPTPTKFDILMELFSSVGVKVNRDKCSENMKLILKDSE